MAARLRQALDAAPAQGSKRTAGEPSRTVMVAGTPSRSSGSPARVPGHQSHHLALGRSGHDGELDAHRAVAAVLGVHHQGVVGAVGQHGCPGSGMDPSGPWARRAARRRGMLEGGDARRRPPGPARRQHGGQAADRRTDARRPQLRPHGRAHDRAHRRGGPGGGAQPADRAGGRRRAPRVGRPGRQPPVLYMGGPVETERRAGLGRRRPEAGLGAGLDLGARRRRHRRPAPGARRRGRRPGPDPLLRRLLRWGGGQLEAELAEGAWLGGRRRRGRVRGRHRRHVAGGPAPPGREDAMLAHFPAHPSLN